MTHLCHPLRIHRIDNTVDPPRSFEKCSAVASREGFAGTPAVCHRLTFAFAPGRKVQTRGLIANAAGRQCTASLSAVDAPSQIALAASLAPRMQDRSRSRSRASQIEPHSPNNTACPHQAVVRITHLAIEALACRVAR